MAMIRVRIPNSRNGLAQIKVFRRFFEANFSAEVVLFCHGFQRCLRISGICPGRSHHRQRSSYSWDFMGPYHFHFPNRPDSVKFTSHQWPSVQFSTNSTGSLWGHGAMDSRQVPAPRERDGRGLEARRHGLDLRALGGARAAECDEYDECDAHRGMAPGLVASTGRCRLDAGQRWEMMGWGSLMMGCLMMGMDVKRLDLLI